MKAFNTVSHTKAFDMVSRNILIDNLKHRLGNWTGAGMNCRALRLVTSDTKTRWRPDNSAGPTPAIDTETDTV